MPKPLKIFSLVLFFIVGFGKVGAFAQMSYTICYGVKNSLKDGMTTYYTKIIELPTGMSDVDLKHAWEEKFKSLRPDDHIQYEVDHYGLDATKEETQEKFTLWKSLCLEQIPDASFVEVDFEFTQGD